MNIDLEFLAIQNPWWKIAGKKEPSFSFFELGLPNHKSSLFDNEFQIEELKTGAIVCLNGVYGSGKSSIIKEMIKDLIEKKTAPENIFYYSCHNVDTYEQLNELIKIFLKSAGKEKKYIFIDEIALIKDWRKGIKYLCSSGKLRSSVLVVASSFKLDNKEVIVKNKIISGLSFSEFLKYLNPDLDKKINEKNFFDLEHRLEYYLDIYFLVGGFSGPLNNYFVHGGIEQSVYHNYLNRLIADLAKTGRDPILFRQIMEQVITNLGEPLGYQTISKKTKAKTHLTIAEYLSILEAMMIIDTVYQTGDGKPTSRKAKKIYFSDPFLFWLFYSYIYGSTNAWRFSREHLHKKEVFDCLIENLVFNHLKKNFGANSEISYWRDNVKKKEINFILKDSKKITPILIRYNKEIGENEKEIVQSAGFKQGIIISKDILDLQGNIKIMPLIYFLLFYFK